MGTARRLTDQEVKEWLVKVPYSKGDLKRFKSIEHPDWIRTEEYDRSHTQRQYEFFILEQFIDTLDGHLMDLGEEDSSSFDNNTGIRLENLDHCSTGEPMSTVMNG